MNKPVLAIGLGLTAVLAGCSVTSAPMAPKAPEAKAPNVQPYEATGAPAGPALNHAAGQEYEELLRKLREQASVNDQQKLAQADEYYRLAERYYGSHDFEKAEAECRKAMTLNPNHGAAHALWLEVQFALGRGKVTPQSMEIARYINEAVARRQAAELEIDDALQNGQRAYNRGDYDDAERSFRRVLEYAKWLPTGVQLETRRREAADLLERTKMARKQKDIDDARARRILIEEEKAREEVRKKYEQRRELELLFAQAQLLFERENYTRCVQICDKILYIDPRLASVEEMKAVALRLNHVAADRSNTKLYIEQWKRTFERIELMGVVQSEELEFPSRELWEEVITRRKPKGVLEEAADELSDTDQAIANKLREIKVDLDYQNQPLTDVVNYIREVSGLNVVIDSKTIPDPTAETFSIKVKNISLEGALKILLPNKQKAHTIEDGVVIVTTTDALKKKVRLELYPVQDLTYGLQDFPGVNITLDDQGLGTAAAGAEEGAKQQFTGEDLANLIKNTIDKDNWDEANGQSVVFQNGLLIVRNALDVHKKIRKFLNDLRASTGILVSIETRFLSVEDNFLQQVGMDFRDVDGTRVAGVLSLDDINPAFSTLPGQQFSQFVDPDGGGGPLAVSSPGITGTFGNNVARNLGARIQNIMQNDQILARFYNQSLGPLGGLSMQYTLLDDISLEAIIRMVSRSQRQHMLTAPKLTLFNTQRGNIRISNQFAYIRDYDIQVATAAAAADPVPAVVTDGISLDVRPIVSSDRRFITVELRPTVATLFPLPPQVFGITISLQVPGNLITPTLQLLIETPILNVQTLRTTVVIPDRGTLLIGGLTVYFEEDAETSVPMWRNIPILGNLGSEKVKGRQRRQMLTLLRARIIIPDEEEKRRFD